MLRQRAEHGSRMGKVKIEGSEVTATVSFGKVEDGGFGIAVKMDVLVKGVDRETAERLVQKLMAHALIPALPVAILK